MQKKTTRILNFMTVFFLSFGIMSGLQMMSTFAASGSKTIQTAKGGRHMMLLKDDGKVYAKGKNEHGQLGIDSTTDSSSVVEVVGLTEIKAIAAGENHSLALKEDGLVFFWGQAGNGQSGNGRNTDETTPVQVQGLTGIIAIAAGDNHSLALKNDGTVFAFGMNDKNQIGDGTTINRPLPVKVAGLSGIRTISAGENTSIAVKQDHSVFVWGYDKQTDTYKSTPTKITEPPNTTRSIGISNRTLNANPNVPTNNSTGATTPGLLMQSTSSTLSSSSVVPSVTGQVYPVVYDDLGYGQEFLDAYAVKAELRDLYDSSIIIMQTTAVPDGTSGSGTFTFQDVPTGNYALVLYRPGYLVYATEVYIDTTTQSFGGGTYELWPGDCDGDGYTDYYMDYYCYVNDYMGYGWNDFGVNLPFMDFNGDGYIDSNDESLFYAYDYYETYDYPNSIYPYLGELSVSFPRLLNVPENLRVTSVTTDAVTLAWDAVTGAVHYYVTYGNSYKITYGTSITITDLDPGTTYQLNIHASSDFSSYGKIGVITVQTNRIGGTTPDGDYAIDAVAGKSYILLLNGAEFTSGLNDTFTMIYDPTELTLVDFAAQTKAVNATTGIVSDTPITILSSANGTVTFKINKALLPGKTWSGVLTAVKFTAITTGETVVAFEQQ